MTETNLNILVSILETVFFITLTILAIFIIVSIRDFLKTVSRIEKEFNEISNEFRPVITELKYITEDVKVIVDRAHCQYSRAELVSEALIEKASGIVNFINKFERMSNGYFTNAANYFKAVNKGFKTFGSYFQKRI